jgi:hypothetical protein
MIANANRIKGEGGFSLLPKFCMFSIIGVVSVEVLDYKIFL